MMMGSGRTAHRKNATMTPRSAAAFSETLVSGRSSSTTRIPVASLPGVPPHAATPTVSYAATIAIPNTQLSAGRNGAMADTTVVVRKNKRTSTVTSMARAPTR